MGPEKSRRVKKSHVLRQPLIKQTILQTALKLADDKGFDVLSMRQPGCALNIEAMSIYHYFKSKNDLLDGLAAHNSIVTSSNDATTSG